MGQFNVPPGVSLSQPGGPNDPARERYERICEALHIELYAATRSGFSREEINEIWREAAECAYFDEEEELRDEEEYYAELERRERDQAQIREPFDTLEERADFYRD